MCCVCLRACPCVRVHVCVCACVGFLNVIITLTCLVQIGNFTHVFPVRLHMRAEMTFLELVKHIDQTVISLQSRRLLALSDIQEM